MTNPEQKDSTEQVSLTYLFFTFLKIGATAFGGFIALVAVVRNQLVEKDKKLSDENIYDGISLGSMLPGPLAVNVVTYLGYRLRGVPGALISWLAVLIPSFILMYVLSYIYFEYGNLPTVENLFKGILPTVCAIILAMAFRMGKKSIKDYKQLLLLIASGCALFFLSAFYITISIIVGGGIIGYFLYKDQTNNSDQVNLSTTKSNKIPRDFLKFIGILTIVIALLLIIPSFFSETKYWEIHGLRKLLVTFGSMSATLFGGGYVFIPSIKEIVVDGLHWLNNTEFADGIALGQITPGPIMISATFIGYKLLGFWGALVATIGMFLPTGLIMIFCSHYYDKLKQSSSVQAAFKGVRPVVVGMIVAAGFIIAKTIEPDWQGITIFAISLLVSILTKLNIIYLILASGVAGILLY